MEKIVVFEKKKEIFYSEESVLSFKAELYLLIYCILEHSFHCAIPFHVKDLLEKHLRALKTEIGEDNSYMTKVKVFYKDKFNKKYDIKFATEEDLVEHKLSFKGLRTMLETKRSIMYSQKSWLTFKSATIKSSRAPKFDEFYTFFKPKKTEFFIYNQKVYLQVYQNAIIFVCEYSIKTFVIKLKRVF